MTTTDPVAAVVVPGLADSGVWSQYVPLIDRMTSVLPTDTVIHFRPNSWSMDHDIPNYSATLVQEMRRLCLDNRHRLILIGFSLGGVAIADALARSGLLSTLSTPPLLITLASPLNGSNRFARAYAAWRDATVDTIPNSQLNAIAEQLRPDSPITVRCRAVLQSVDAHLLLNESDPIVDEDSGWPVDARNVHVHSPTIASRLKRHLAFPAEASVLDEVENILQRHVVVRQSAWQPPARLGWPLDKLPSAS